MKDRIMKLPELVFIVATRGMLGAGIALLASRRMKKRTRMQAGTVLVAIGAITTVPAVLMVIRSGQSEPASEP